MGTVTSELRHRLYFLRATPSRQAGHLVVRPHNSLRSRPTRVPTRALTVHLHTARPHSIQAPTKPDPSTNCTGAHCTKILEKIHLYSSLHVGAPLYCKCRDKRLHFASALYARDYAYVTHRRNDCGAYGRRD